MPSGIPCQCGLFLDNPPQKGRLGIQTSEKLALLCFEREKTANNEEPRVF
jgi:hypothetical protein